MTVIVAKRTDYSAVTLTCISIGHATATDRKVKNRILV